MYRAFLATASILAIGSSAALAADLGPMATKAPAFAAAPALWTGFYAGLNAGYAWGKSDGTAVTNPRFAPISVGTEAIPSLKPQGFIGGAQFGYNWQTGPWVLGGEVDFSGMDTKSSQFVRPFFSGKAFSSLATFSSQYDWLATARLRAGVAVAPSWLLYVTGGLAVTHVKDSITGNPGNFFGNTSFTWSDSKTLFGGALGGGLEFAFSGNWSAKVEYLYAKFESTTPGMTASTEPGVNGPITTFKHDLSLVRLGVNYKFGG